MKKLIMRYLMMWIFLHLGLYAFTQQSIDVNGKIVDENSSALPGATIELIHQKTNKKSTVMADVNGLFTLNALVQGDSYSIHAHHLGYSSDSITNFSASGTTKNTILFRLK